MFLFMQNRCLCSCLLLVLTIVFISASADASDIDTQLRIEQNIEKNSHHQELDILKDEDYLGHKHPELILEGKSYPVKHNVNDLGRALYVSLQEKNWSAAQYFLSQYQSLHNPDPQLLAYAKGSLARIKGDLQSSIKEFQHLLSLNAHFLPGQLALARVLFEDHQDRAASSVFAKIAKKLNADNKQQKGVGRTVTSFSSALKKRGDWARTVIVGGVWKDNLNQSSQSETCLLSYQGQCIYTRTLPEAISAAGLDYQLTASKKWSFAKHHGLYTKSLWYGQRYDEYSQYNQSTFNSQLGYRYQDIDTQIRLAPLFEFSSYGTESLYSAWGLHGEWTENISRQRMFKFNVDYKELRYKKDNYQRYDGPSYSLNATLWQGFTDNWTVFGGVDWLNRLAEDRPYAYRQVGMRIGVSKIFTNKLSTTLYGAVRQQSYHEFSNLLGERREDNVINITLVVKAPNLSLFGVTPSLTLSHFDTRSNVDWLYSQRSNEISLKIEKSF